MKKLIIIFLFAVFCGITAAQTAVQPAAGDGSESNPYQIATLDNLYWISAPDSIVPIPDHLDRWSSHYIQTNDIDASPTQNWFPDGQGSYQGWIPVGYDYNNNFFSGSYNGDNHTISGLYINRPSTNLLGLFGCVREGIIENVGVIDVLGYGMRGSLAGVIGYTTIRNCYSTENLNAGMGYGAGGLIGNGYFSSIIDCHNAVDIVDGYLYTGGLIGYANSVEIINCYNSGHIVGRTYTGGLVGYATNSQHNHSIIQNCYNSGTIEGTNHDVGGLIGVSVNYQISDCYNLGNVVGHLGVGGLFGSAGSMDGSSILKCYNIGNVSGNSVVGGISGTFGGNLEKCFNSGNVYGEWDYLGGLCGYSNYHANFSNCYNTGNVTGNPNRSEYLGGLLGNAVSSTISNSYSTGFITGLNYTGGCIGDIEFGANITNTYWDIETSGQLTSTGGTGRTTNEMTYPYDPATYVNWNFDDIWFGDENYLHNNGYPLLTWQIEQITVKKTQFTPQPGHYTEAIDITITSQTENATIYFRSSTNSGSWTNWQLYLTPQHIPVNTRIEFEAYAEKQDLITSAVSQATYIVAPELATPPFAGSGTIDNPYQIATLEDLYWIAAPDSIVPLPDRAVRWNSHYIQVDNIDASPTQNWFPDQQRSFQGWLPIGSDLSSFFSGSYNGQGFTISNLYIDRSNSDDLGLFGYLNGANISNLNLSLADVSGHDNIGILVGQSGSGSYIDNCHVSGTISGNNHVGGMVGWQHDDFTIMINCTSAATVTGVDQVGGLCGFNFADCQIENCEASGNVTGNNSIGGLCGYNHAFIYFSSASGLVIGNSYVGGLAGHCLGEITDSKATGTVQGNNNVGAHTGVSNGLIERCFATGNVSATSLFCGGFVGQITNGIVSNCYARGGVTGTSDRGGFVGYLSVGQITNCYSTGIVPAGGLKVNGFAGSINSMWSSISNSYWDVNTSGLGSSGSNNEGATGRSTVEMTYPYAANTFMGWDFVDFWLADDGYLYNNGYPLFIWQIAITSVEAPQFSPDPGIYSSPVNVTISSQTENAVINYRSSVNSGTWSNWQVYSDPIIVPFQTQINLEAFAEKTGFSTSSVSQASYHVTGATANQPQQGNGTIGNPYQIATLENLFWIAAPDSIVPIPDQAARWSSHYIQIEDIDASPTQNWFPDGQGGFYSWSPIGGYIQFSGSYNGDGHTISDLYINRSTSYLGLFGITSSTSFIENLDLLDVDITCSNANAMCTGALVGLCFGQIDNCFASGVINGKGGTGGLIGELWTDGTITNSHTEGTVSGGAGGLVGNNRGTITNSYSTADLMNSSDSKGGFVSYNEGTIDNCYASGFVSGGGNGSAGGFIYNNSGTITNSYATGNVSANALRSGGGFAAENNNTIFNCYATGNVSGGAAGGLIGVQGYGGSVENSYAKGNVTNTYSWFPMYAGGFIGINYGGCPISNCYSRGNVIRDHNESSALLGGFIGKNQQGIITNCFSTGFVAYSGAANPEDKGFAAAVDTTGAYAMSGNYWDMDTSYQSATAGNAEGRSTWNMTYPYSAETYVGWDFDDVWQEDMFMIFNDGYPYLQMQFHIPSPEISVSPESFEVTLNTDDNIVLPITITNDGDVELIFSITTDGNQDLAVKMAKVSRKNSSEKIDIGDVNDLVRSDWLSAFPFSGIVPADDEAIIDITFDTIGMASGTYNANIIVANNAADDVLVQVTLNVTTEFAIPPDMGDGTEANPYQIASLGNLMWISSTSSSWNKHFIQTADIDAVDTQNWNDGAGFNPIGNSSVKFSGRYNGLDHIINGLYINRPTEDNQGLFGYTTGAAIIENLGVTNVNIQGDSRCGGVAGYLTDFSILTHCFSTGSVNGISNVGGLVGIMFYNCGIHFSYSTCNVIASSTYSGYAGGIVGTSRGAITHTYSTGSVSGHERIGGLIGYTAYAYVTDCYSTSIINGGAYTGGLIGYNDNTSVVSNCFSTGTVNASAAYTGGLVGRNFNSTVSNSFWDMETSGKTISAAGTGKTTLEMKNVATFTDLTTAGLSAPWDFVGNPYDDASNMDYWDMFETNNSGYPYLNWQQFYPAADFAADQTVVLLGSQIQFSDLTSGHPTSWEWDFDADETIDSFEQNPTCIYPVAGIYSVSLTSENDLGNDIEIKTNYITVWENSAPYVANSLADFSFNEDTIDNSIDLNVVFDDDNIIYGDDLSFSFSGNVSISVEISAAGIVTLTPAQDWFGNETITFTATDNFSESVSDDVIVAVNPVNDDPVIISYIPETTIVNMDEGGSQFFEVIAEDVDLDMLSYQWYMDNVLIPNVIISSYTFNPDYSSAGQHSMKCVVDDGVSDRISSFGDTRKHNYAGNSDATAFQEWTVNVTDVDQQIVVTNLSYATNTAGVWIPTNQTINEIETLNFSITANDPDGNTLDYSWKLDGTEVSTTDYYDFITDYNSAGNYLVTLDVTDNFGVTDSAKHEGEPSDNFLNYTWNVEVIDVDQSIVVTDLAYASNTSGTWIPTDQTINETEALNFSITAYDPDGNALDYSWKLDGVEISTVATYNFTTNYTSVGNYVVNLDVTDNYGLADNVRKEGGPSDNILNYTWNINVLDVDQDIVVTDLSYATNTAGTWIPTDQTINETETLNFSITAYDPDGNILEYSWKLDGIETSTTDLYDFTTDYTSAGNYIVTIDVTDNFGAENILNYFWNVTVTDVDQPIVVTDLAYATNTAGIWMPTDQTINEMETLNFGVIAYDPDGNELAYNWKLDGTEVSTAASYDFTTDYTSAGNYVITVDVTDNFGASDNAKHESEPTDNILSYTWNVNVLDVDQPIEVTDLAYATNTAGIWMPTDQTINEMDVLNFSIMAYDPDGNTLDYSWKLDGIEVSTIEQYNFITDFTSAGIYDVTLDVTDNFGVAEELRCRDNPTDNILNYTWNIEVIDLDQPIVVDELIPPEGNLIIDEEYTIEFSINAYDPDGNELEYSWQLDGEEVSTIDSYTFVTNGQSAGDYVIILDVTDNFGTLDDELNFTWNVHVNDTVGSGVNILPVITQLYQNYPNPFNPTTTIRFDIKENESGRLTIFNMKGQIIVSEEFETGKHQYHWNAEGLSSGIYFYKLSSPTTNITKKMILMK